MAVGSASNRPSPEHIFSTLNAHQQTAALTSAIELDLFTSIDEGNSTVEDLAKRVKASTRGVRTLCDYLTILGFLRKENGRYELTQDSTLFLSRRSPNYMGTIAEFLTNRRHFENLAKLTEAVRHGGTAGEKGGNREPDDALWVSFARSMAPLTVPAALFIADLVRAQAEWPAVLEVAKENAEKAGVADRYETRPGSAFETELGQGYDLVLLTNIFHHFDQDTCVQLMRRVHRALKPDGRAVTLEFVPNEDRVSPPIEAAFSLLMLVGTDAGDAYTLSEYENMFAKAGFGKTSLHRIPTMAQEVLVSEK
jgi:hypothetical protein